MKRFCLCFLLLLCCLASPVRAAEAPGMGAMLLLGEIAQHKGKVVILNFFATWCAPCREEIPGLINLRRRYPPEELTILGISLDEDPALVQSFARERGINYPVKRASEDVLHMFSIRSVPHNAVYDAAGRLVANQPGFVPEETFRDAVDKLLERRQ